MTLNGVTPGKPMFYVTGKRYLGGTAVGADGITYYGIWDAQSPGPPIEKYDTTDEGWKQVQRFFVDHRDPNLHSLDPRITCPTCGEHMVEPLKNGTGNVVAATLAFGLIGTIASSSSKKRHASFHCFSCGYHW